jgi:hypothetical protein
MRTSVVTGRQDLRLQTVDGRFQTDWLDTGSNLRSTL